MDATNQALISLGADPIKFPQFPHIMAGMLDEASFEQKNAVFKDVLAHTKGLKAATVESDKALKKAQAAGAAKVASELLSELHIFPKLCASWNDFIQLEGAIESSPIAINNTAIIGTRGGFIYTISVE